MGCGRRPDGHRIAKSAHSARQRHDDLRISEQHNAKPAGEYQTLFTYEPVKRPDAANRSTGSIRTWSTCKTAEMCLLRRSKMRIAQARPARFMWPISV